MKPFHLNYLGVKILQDQQIKLKMRTHFGGGCNLRKLLVGDDNRPRFPCFTEHLLCLELLTLFQNQVSYALCRRRRRVEHFLHAVHKRHRYLRRALYLTALYLHFARRVRFLRLTRVALRQKLHTRRRSRIQRVELDSHSRQELQHCAIRLGVVKSKTNERQNLNQDGFFT